MIQKFAELFIKSNPGSITCLNVAKTLCVFLIFISFSCKQEPTNTKLSGSVFGTTYSVIYDSEVNYEKQFDSLFAVINKSMSTYIPDSDISKLNRNEAVSVDAHFLHVFNASNEIYHATDGAFDPTIGAVVNAWDFGPEGKIIALDSVKIDSLMQGVGFSKISAKNNTITKPKSTFIDFNAIAKGYGVDVIGVFLESKNVNNYLVEIGGEIRTRGKNEEKQSDWKVGVELPNYDGEQSILNAISLHDESMATSGTYRKFKVDENGNRYSHIIDAKTGYPSKTNLLSISVLAKDCMTADAYATAFKAMGLDHTKEFLKSHTEIKVFLIFENDDKEFETLAINGFPEE
ncbi:FAD:protein FMN transferase [Bizionia argentinensis JUB59]|uniref:FAD:protein FMN transferase n=1 Tax=Bizionia argentinensis JUB59 TaxID=1046627 RepID=G2EBT7_9FLAO|nr:FAD:protein FMN transferase [Bizionia argentinensis]EGV44087.2 FAD:protein FMN transferase [Bizionia argentinensis JUB59]